MTHSKKNGAVNVIALALADFLAANADEKAAKARKDAASEAILKWAFQHGARDDKGTLRLIVGDMTVTVVEAKERSIETGGFIELTREFQLGDNVRNACLRVASAQDGPAFALVKAGLIPAERLTKIVTETPKKPYILVK